MASILVIDDEPKMTSLICGHLEDEGHTVATTTKPAEALELLVKHAYDVVITDLSMPEVSGMTILEKALERKGTDVVMMTAYGTAESAVEAMKKGAADYLLKPFSLEELSILVTKLTSHQKERSIRRHFQREVESSYGNMIGKSAAMQAVMKLIEKVATSDATVLLTGRSGTGKELAARRVHDLSNRKDKPFIAVNCAALTETLLESELFGHEKGAFTGAADRKRGRFELAEGGTIFLDEIGETSPGMQSKLLRVLEERKLVRVGGVDLIPIDVRVIAATNRRLKDEVIKGNFREDLYFRINVFPVEMPDLSDRKDDIVDLARHFLEAMACRHSELSNDVERLLLAYDWPGNIRELRNVIERAVILAGGEPLSADDFNLETDNSPLSMESNPNSVGDSGLANAERQMILGALKQTEGNKSEAARLLKITRRRLYSRMKVLGIEV